MRYIGVDCGSKSAIAMIDDKEIIGIESINLGHKVNKEAKFLNYFNWLLTWIKEFKPVAVYTEEIFLGPTMMKAAMSLYGKVGVIRLACETLQVPLTLIKPSVVKATACGKGGGRGIAGKLAVANGLLDKVDNPDIIKTLIGQSKWDETDSVAIALAGYRTGGL